MKENKMKKMTTEQKEFLKGLINFFEQEVINNNKKRKAKQNGK